MNEPQYPDWFLHLPFPIRVILNFAWAIVTLPARWLRR